jgi:DNA-binding beta-propeller fold protein YncE
MTRAIDAIVPTDGFGPVGLAVTPDGRHALVSASEGDQLEHGGRTISVISPEGRITLHLV